MGKVSDSKFRSSPCSSSQEKEARCLRCPSHQAAVTRPTGVKTAGLGQPPLLVPRIFSLFSHDIGGGPWLTRAPQSRIFTLGFGVDLQTWRVLGVERENRHAWRRGKIKPRHPSTPDRMLAGCPFCIFASRGQPRHTAGVVRP